MQARQRKRYSAAFKAGVALEAIKGELTLVQLAAKHDVHHIMIANWKRKAIVDMTTSFSGRAVPAGETGAEPLDAFRERLEPAPARPLEPRKQPRQERAVGMVERILEAARAQLSEANLSDFSTVSIARRANLSVGSIYQYFPNKESIIWEIAQRWLGLFKVAATEWTRSEPPGDFDSFAASYRAFHQGIASIYRRTFQFRRALDALSLTAELSRLNVEHNEIIVGMLADWLMRINPVLARKVAWRLAWAVYGSGDGAMSAAARSDPDEGELIIEDLNIMTLALLRPHLYPD